MDETGTLIVRGFADASIDGALSAFDEDRNPVATRRSNEVDGERFGARLEFRVFAGETYFVQLDSLADDDTEFPVEYEVDTLLLTGTGRDNFGNQADDATRVRFDNIDPTSITKRLTKTRRGTIERAFSQDVFELEIPEQLNPATLERITSPGTLRVSVTSARRSPLDPVVSLTDDRGRTLEFNDDVDLQIVDSLVKLSFSLASDLLEAFASVGGDRDTTGDYEVTFSFEPAAIDLGNGGVPLIPIEFPTSGDSEAEGELPDESLFVLAVPSTVPAGTRVILSTDSKPELGTPPLDTILTVFEGNLLTTIATDDNSGRDTTRRNPLWLSHTSSSAPSVAIAWPMCRLLTMS